MTKRPAMRSRGSVVVHLGRHRSERFSPNTIFLFCCSEFVTDIGFYDVGVTFPCVSSFLFCLCSDLFSYASSRPSPVMSPLIAAIPLAASAWNPYTTLGALPVLLVLDCGICPEQVVRAPSKNTFLQRVRVVGVTLVRWGLRL